MGRLPRLLHASRDMDALKDSKQDNGLVQGNFIKGRTGHSGNAKEGEGAAERFLKLLKQDHTHTLHTQLFFIQA